jgi:heme exporter protein B
MNEVKAIVLKEFKQEYRQKYLLGSILLYTLATVFTSYISFRSINHPPTWNALFWIILIFSAINSTSKSFLSENSGRQLYLYSLSSPHGILFGKTIYNVLLMWVVAIFTLLIYSGFLGNLIQNWPLFLLNLFLGTMAFTSVLTIVSAITAKAGGNPGLMAILSFPLMIPLLMNVLRVSKNAIDGIDPSLSYPFLLVTLLINLVVLLLGYILFPYLWRA